MTEEEFNPRRELFRRYGETFRAAWRERRVTTGSRRYTSAEADFLPSSLAVSERPTPIMPHVALWSACALFLCAIAWSLIGKMDVVVVAGGKVLAIGKTKAIQSVEPQVVRRVFVSEGQSVAEGDILIEFDPRSAEADQKRYRADHERALAMQWINETLLVSLGDRPISAPLKISTQPPEAFKDLAQETVRSRWDEYRAKVDRATADLARRRAERQALNISIASLEERTGQQLRLEADYRKMFAANAVSRHALLEHQTKAVELRTELSRSRAQRQQLDLATTEAEAALALTYASDKAAWRERLVEAQREASVALSELRKAEYRMSLNVIHAPAAGRVQQLTLTAPGAVASSGQQIMALVPDGEVEEVEAMVENRDVGFLQVGQHAEIKLEAFDYTRYGTLPAKITMISPDAVADEKGNLRYPVRLRLEKSALTIGDRVVPVAPGMVAYADVLSGRRSIFSYFLSPILKTLQESMRDR